MVHFVWDSVLTNLKTLCLPYLDLKLTFVPIFSRKFDFKLLKLFLFLSTFYWRIQYRKVYKLQVYSLKYHNGTMCNQDQDRSGGKPGEVVDRITRRVVNLIELQVKMIPGPWLASLPLLVEVELLQQHLHLWTTRILRFVPKIKITGKEPATIFTLSLCTFQKGKDLSYFP